MRPVLMGDIIAVARTLMVRPEEEQAALLECIWQEARAADRFRLRHGRPHPVWGNGSLMAATGRHGRAPEPLPTDARYLRALRLVIDRLLGRKPPFASARRGLYDETTGRKRRPGRWPKPE